MRLLVEQPIEGTRLSRMPVPEAVISHQ
jgi:hypothetical protein